MLIDTSLSNTLYITVIKNINVLNRQMKYPKYSRNANAYEHTYTHLFIIYMMR